MQTHVSLQIAAEVCELELDSQPRVLEYVRSLKHSVPGMRGKALLRHAGTINELDAQSMMDAIEAGCEQVNPDEWQVSARHEHCHCDPES